MFVIAICCTPAFFLLAGAVGLILNQLVVQLVATTLVFGIGYLFLLPLIAIGERELNILNAAVKKYPPLKPMFSLVARLSRL
jgi:hypothetical protein